MEEADLFKNPLPAERRESENPLKILTKSKNLAKISAKSDDPKNPVPPVLDCATPHKQGLRKLNGWFVNILSYPTQRCLWFSF